jgi:hypothetical protein
MSMNHTVTLEHLSTAYNNMITRMDGVRRDVVMMKTQLKEELFFAVT